MRLNTSYGLIYKTITGAVTPSKKSMSSWVSMKSAVNATFFCSKPKIIMDFQSVVRYKLNRFKLNLTEYAIMSTESERLTSRLNAMKREGLVNVKLTLHSTLDITTESVCADVNAMLDAYTGGQCTPLSFNDSHINNISSN
jgi:hypothetical protein